MKWEIEAGQRIEDFTYKCMIQEKITGTQFLNNEPVRATPYLRII